MILYTLDDLFLVRVISIVLLVVDLTSFIKEIETVEWEVHFARWRLGLHDSVIGLGEMMARCEKFRESS